MEEAAIHSLAATPKGLRHDLPIAKFKTFGTRRAR
jgi:hypothetical protein